MGATMKVNTLLAWIAGISAFIAIKTGIDVVANSAGIVTYIDFGETITVTMGSGPASYDEEISGASTTFGFSTMIIAGMIACRIGAAINSGRIDGGLSAKDKIDFIAWLAGFVIAATVGALLFALFEDHHSDLITVFYNALELSAFGFAFYICKSWRNNMINRLTNPPLADHENNSKAR
jgi:hypothetical protein